MQCKYTLIATLTACAVLTACGGGESSSTDPQTVALSALSAKAGVASPSTSSNSNARPERRIQAYSADRAAQLFAKAEATYGTYFPSKQATRSFNGWSYRYYPETQVYLAVIDSDVYVLGGAFGTEVMRVGAVSDFVDTAATGKDRPLTATILAQCPDASASTSAEFYKCMVGYLEGTQTFDTSKNCRLEITDTGVFTLSSDNKLVTVGPTYGLPIYSKMTSNGLISASVQASSDRAFRAEVKLRQSTGFSFTAGGKLDAEATPEGSSTASISCRLIVPK